MPHIQARPRITFESSLTLTARLAKRRPRKRRHANCGPEIGDEDKGGEACEFEILLCTGGPAIRIVGELNGGEVHRAYLQVQDWGTPWTDYHEEGIAAVLEAYCGCFCFDC